MGRIGTVVVVRIVQILRIFGSRANRVSWWIGYKIKESMMIPWFLAQSIRRMTLPSPVMIIGISYQFSATRYS